jgi:transposase
MPSEKEYRPYHPRQILLLPPSLQDWLPEDHLAYFIDDVVEHFDLEAIEATYEDELRGGPPYHPVMMVKLLLYAYCTGVYSSRRIATHVREDVAFRVLAAGNVPDFRTISEFRRRHLAALSGLFQQVVVLGQQAKLIKLRHVAVDGTKVRANASKHKAMSYDRLCRDEARIKAEVAEWFRRAAEIDAAEDAEYGPDRSGDEMPEELRRRESRLEWIRKAKAALEAEAKAKAERARAAQAANAAERAARPANRRGPTPKPPRETPDDRMQYNFTDPESRIMKNADGAFIQAYNVQAAVDAAHHLIVATDVTAQAADAPHLQPLATAIVETTGHRPRRLSADAGYFSEDAVTALVADGIDPYIATEKGKHSEPVVSAPRGRIPGGLSVKDRMRRKLRTKAGHAVYRMRKAIPEPVFGQIKEVRQFTRFLLRGQVKVCGEWLLVATAHNLCRLFAARSRVEAVLRMATG